MKKLLSVILAISILLSTAVMPTMAEETETENYVRTFDEVLCINFDREPSTASGSWRYYSIPGHKYFSNSYVYNGSFSNSPEYEITDKFGTGENGTLITSKVDNASIAYTTLRKDHTSNDELNSAKGTELRSGDVAITIQAAITEYTVLKASVYGLDKDNNTKSTALLSITTDKIESGKLVDYKIILDYDKATYVVYADNAIIGSGELAGKTNYYQFGVSATVNGAKASAAGVEPYVFLNKYALTILSEDDTASQYSVENKVGGNITLEGNLLQSANEYSYTVTPDEGYTVKNVTIGGEVQEGIAPEGGNYTFIATPGVDNVITAEYKENRKFDRVFEFPGTSVPIANWQHWKLGTAYKQISTYGGGTANMTMTSVDKFNTGNPGILHTATEEGASSSTSYYIYHNDYNDMPFTEKGIEIRNGHTALTFKAALSDYASLKVNSYGLATTTDFTNGVPTTGYLSTFMMEVGNTSTGFSSYNHTKDSSNYKGTTSYANTIKRGVLCDYKFIFDYNEGTYDVYIDNKLVAENRTLAGAKYLAKYYISVSVSGAAAKEAGKESWAYVDDIRLYTLTDEELKAQYSISESDGGVISIANDITTPGEEVSYTIKPNEGYTVKSVTISGEVQEGIAPEGGTYTFIAKAGENNVISAEYDTYRILKKEFDLDFEKYNDGATYVSQVNSFANCSENNVSYGNIYANAGAKGIIEAQDENKLLKIELPALKEDATTKSNAKINFLWQNNEVFGGFTSEPFAISYKLALSEGIDVQFEADDRGANRIGSSIFNNTDVCGINNYDYEQSSTLNYASVYSKMDLSGLHEYKYIVKPETGCYDMFVDGNLVAENVRLRSASTLYYFRLAITNKTGENDLTAYLDDFRLYLLTDEYTDVQTDVEIKGNGKVETTKEFIKKGETATYTIIPDEGSYIKNVVLNGNPIPAFNSENVVIDLEDTTVRNTITAEFGNFSEGAPAIDRAVYTARDDEGVYIFFKYNANGTTPDEWGVAVSANDSDETLVPVKADAVLAEKGYFGYKIITDSGFYVKGYAKIGDEVFYGKTEFIHPYQISDIVE